MANHDLPHAHPRTLAASISAKRVPLRIHCAAVGGEAPDIGTGEGPATVLGRCAQSPHRHGAHGKPQGRLRTFNEATALQRLALKAKVAPHQRRTDQGGRNATFSLNNNDLRPTPQAGEGLATIDAHYGRPRSAALQAPGHRAPRSAPGRRWCGSTPTPWTARRMAAARAGDRPLSWATARNPRPPSQRAINAGPPHLQRNSRLIPALTELDSSPLFLANAGIQTIKSLRWKACS